jgi:hypothetical protein
MNVDAFNDVWERSSLHLSLARQRVLGHARREREAEEADGMGMVREAPKPVLYIRREGPPDHFERNRFIRNHRIPCLSCNSTGLSATANHLRDNWIGISAFEPSMTGSAPYTALHPIIREFVKNRLLDLHPDLEVNDTDLHRKSEQLASLYNRCWSHHLGEADIQALEDKGILQRDGRSQAEINESLIQSRLPPEAPNICIEAKCNRLGGYDFACSVCQGKKFLWDSPEYEQLAEKQVVPKLGGLELPTWQAYVLSSKEGEPHHITIGPRKTVAYSLAVWMDRQIDKRGITFWMDMARGGTRIPINSEMLKGSYILRSTMEYYPTYLTTAGRSILKMYTEDELAAILAENAPAELLTDQDDVPEPQHLKMSSNNVYRRSYNLPIQGM